MSLAITTLRVDEYQNKILNKDSFVLNVVASWCPDCTEQQRHLDSFIKALAENGISVFELTAQHRKGEYLSADIVELIAQFGGHGFPRTILIKEGKISSANNVEVINEADLLHLAEVFKTQLSK